MAALTECPACHRRAPVETEQLGQEVTCPSCQGRYSAVDVGRPPGVRKHRAALAFGLGVLALAVFGIFGPFAWLLARSDLKRMERGETDPSGMKTARIALTMGKFGTIKFAIEVLLIVAVVAAILAVAYYAAEQGVELPF